jgi:leucyl aminopeptidase
VTTSIAATATPAHEIDADTVVIAVAAGAAGPVPIGGSETIDDALGGRLRQALLDLGATGKAGETVGFVTLGATRAPAVLAVGLGPLAEITAPDGTYQPGVLRRAAGVATRALAGRARVATTLALANGETGPAEARAVAEGSLLGAYSFDTFRATSVKDRPAPVGEVVVLVSTDPLTTRIDAELRRSAVVGEVVSLVRDLVNTPPGHLPPAKLADTAADLATQAGVSVDVLDVDALAAGGYGGILGVGQGSVNPPRLVRLDWRPDGTGVDDPPALALVGKGITFDSGGLSLKPATSMEWMKTDMAGSAAVLATVLAAAKLNLPVAITGWMPLAENMPSGTAIRPSDVLTMYGGRRVEVLNTDAEGRLVLADALVRAAEDSPGLLVDIATLTGGQIVALGNRTSGVMGRDAAVGAVLEAAGRADESFWSMPFPPELRKGLDSAVADIANVAGGGGRDGSMVVAGMFLDTFVPDGVAWAHLDIAGPSWNTGEPYGYTPKGGTGVAVRTLLELAESLQ